MDGREGDRGGGDSGPVERLTEPAAGHPWGAGARGEWWVVGQMLQLAALVLAPARWTWGGAPRTAGTAAGLAVLAAGLTLAARGVRDLGPNLTSFPRPRARAVLVRTGVYARVRHPIYGGLVLAAFGWALLRASGLHLLLATVLAVYLTLKSAVEEAYLTARFPEYAEYRTRTRRLIPGLY